LIKAELKLPRSGFVHLPNIIDKKSSSVRQLIIRVSDQLKAGEIRLIDWTPEETKEAKARLDAQRKKRRERHAKKKAVVDCHIILRLDFHIILKPFVL